MGFASPSRFTLPRPPPKDATTPGLFRSRTGTAKTAQRPFVLTRETQQWSGKIAGTPLHGEPDWRVGRLGSPCWAIPLLGPGSWGGHASIVSDGLIGWKDDCDRETGTASGATACRSLLPRRQLVRPPTALTYPNDAALRQRRNARYPAWSYRSAASFWRALGQAVRDVYGVVLSRQDRSR